MDNQRMRRTQILLESLKRKNIYLYGAGRRGKVALKNLNRLGMGENVVGFVDDNIKEEYYLGKPVQLTEHIEKGDVSDAVFIITTYAVNQMVCKIMEKGIPVEQIYYFSELLIDDIGLETLQINRNEIEQTYSLLSDDLSKYIFKSLFEVYLDGNIGNLSRTKGDMQYFPISGSSDEIKGFVLSTQESFVDCGAYDGDTIRKFKAITQNRYKKIWAFEPDVDNYSKLTTYIEEQRDARVQLVQGGVYSEDAVMYFDGKRGTSSSLKKTGAESVKVYQLDNIINKPVSFIKMDIEGSETGALLGARRIIAEYKPKLAICIYHQIEDFWRVPLLIKSLNPDYRLYIRNYEDRIDETVCYAV